MIISPIRLRSQSCWNRIPSFLFSITMTNTNKLQHEYKFRWGSDSQHLHTRFLKRREWPSLSHNINGAAGHFSQPSPTTTPICKQYNSASGCQWPNCRFAHICIVKGRGKPHPQTQHTPHPSFHAGNVYAPSF